MTHVRQLENAIWAIADGRASADDVSVFEADASASLFVVDRMISETEEDLANVRGLPGDERDQVVADFADVLDSLLEASYRLRPRPVAPLLEPPPSERLEPEEVRLQASWSDGQIVVWAGGRNVAPETNDQLATGSKPSVGRRSVGRSTRESSSPTAAAPRRCPSRSRTRSGGFVAMGGPNGAPDVGASVLWLGRAAVEGVRLVASGSIVPTLQVNPQRTGRFADTDTRWVPAYLDATMLDRLAASMPGAVVGLSGRLQPGDDHGRARGRRRGDRQSSGPVRRPARPAAARELGHGRR